MSNFRLTFPTAATAVLAAALAVAPATALAAEAHYTIDPSHTFPGFEADHWGLSTWHGKFTRTRGAITLDRAAGTGSVDITVDMASVAFGVEAMDEKARSAEIFDTARYPEARYRGTLAGFVDGKPTRVDGALTLHGVTRPLVLTIERFACRENPMAKREQCGADARDVLARGLRPHRRQGLRLRHAHRAAHPGGGAARLERRVTAGGRRRNRRDVPAGCCLIAQHGHRNRVPPRHGGRAGGADSDHRSISARMR